MAENIISPGVFTRENDLSFLPQGVGSIGAAIVGPTVKGPAFVPTVVRSFAEYERRFGSLSSETYVPQTVREYLRSAGSVTICRVLAGGGYTYTNGTSEIIGIALSGSDNNVLIGAIYPSKAISTPDLKDTTLTGNTGDGKNINTSVALTLSGSNVTKTTLNGSFNPANTDYIFKQLGDNPNNSKTSATAYAGTPGYTYVNFKNLQADIAAATTKEVTTITFASVKFATSSIQETAAQGNSIILSNADNDRFTFSFSSDNSVAATGAGLTGSRTVSSIAALDGGDAHPGISGSVLASTAATAITALKGFSASSLGSVLTINGDSGDQIDVISTFGPATVQPAVAQSATTASLAITTQGVDLTGYKGLSADREIVLLTQSANIVYSGEIGQTEGYGYASTPFITSQFVGGTHPNKTTKELFKFHTLDHGKHLCHDYKISISNVKEPGDLDGVEQYSQFTITLRKTSDKDKNPVILEQYNNVTLDPDSSRYISRVMGDRYPQYNDTLGKVELLGNYPNISNYVRVEVSNAVEERALSPKLSPKGFKAVRDTINVAALLPAVLFPSASYEGVQTLGTTDYNSKGFLGFKFLDKDADNENFLQPLPDTNVANVSGDFNVENFKGHPSSSLFVGSLSASIDSTGATGPTANQLKFTIPFQGGDDGIAPHTVKQIGANIKNNNLYGFDLSTTSAAGYTGYKKAIDILANQDEYDINMLAMPGVIHSLHPLVTNAGIDMVEERGDAFFVMDLNEVGASVNTAVSNVSGIDTNYAAVYYPWVKVLDTAKNKPVLVPPSVIVPGAIAASDAIGAEWFAPAGLNRGILGNVLEAKIRLNQAERDVLYDNKINPIATFPQTGVCIWGQKTLQERSTALDRINVRRLLLTVKKFIASSSRYLVFEQNTTATRNRFLNIVNPYLESVQQRQGLYAFRVQMDESNNTPDVVDRNQLVGAIYLQPTKTAEFIILDFNILPTGATFDGGGGGGGGSY